MASGSAADMKTTPPACRQAGKEARLGGGVPR